MIDVDYREETRMASRRQRSADRQQKQRAIADGRTARRAISRSSPARISFKTWAAEHLGAVCEACRWDPRQFGLSEAEALSVLNAHHVIPVVCGGSESRRNKALLCPNCHAIAHRLGQIRRTLLKNHVWEGPQNRAELLAQLVTTNPTTSDFQAPAIVDAAIAVTSTRHEGSDAILQ